MEFSSKYPHRHEWNKPFAAIVEIPRTTKKGVVTRRLFTLRSRRCVCGQRQVLLRERWIDAEICSDGPLLDP
jgi:hypothetical protein